VDKVGDSARVISSSETLDFSFSISFYQEKEMERRNFFCIKIKEVRKKIIKE
jgi:hypothetical protein